MLIRSLPEKGLFHILMLTVALTWVIAFPTLSRAQTCRIRCGVSSEGQKLYKEVFEYDFVATKPSYPGGDTGLLEFINKNRRYPQRAYEKRIQGRVTCQFVVNTDGSVSNLEIIRGAERSLNEEALRILSLMPAWEPGRIEGRPVPVRVVWSVPFRL
ncbi:MAG: energy transducer TonB [Bacteroides sp.]|nr:energy transducer TonB [Bacteroides sp.]MBD5307384.1 energy transducer TonB [Bacteroides sp.]